ncbi:MAG TPA: hypothetical protein PLK30_18925, partial [Blastocatellia bacterium]|nr:hypothetical protein [Blastocatellia bacterium]
MHVQVNSIGVTIDPKALFTQYQGDFSSRALSLLLEGHMPPISPKQKRHTRLSWTGGDCNSETEWR